MENDKIIIYQTEDGQTQIDVRLENDTVWLTQAQMAELFEKDRSGFVNYHKQTNEFFTNDRTKSQQTTEKASKDLSGVKCYSIGERQRQHEG